MQTVADAVRVFASCSERHAGCAVDFALLSSGETCEVEVNDGEFTAKYDVDFDDDFAAIYVAR